MQNTQDLRDQIPPEAWPLLDLLFNLTFAAAGIWLGITIFILWRRNSSNLTPVHAEAKNARAEPDFLSINVKAREEAIARGESFEKELQRRERKEAQTKARAARSAVSKGQSIARIISFVLALVSLLTGTFGVIFNIVRIEGATSEYGSLEKLSGLFVAYPIAFSFAAIIIVLQIIQFILQHRKTKEG